MYEFVQAQESLLRKAVIRNDRWLFRDEYKHLEVDTDKCFTLTERTQKQHFTSGVTSRRQAGRKVALC